MAIKIDVQKSYEEVEISGVVYRVDLNDDRLKEYIKAFDEFRDESLKISEKEFVEMSKEEQAEATKRNYEIMEKVTDLMLGTGSFEKVYNDTGRSLMVMTNVLFQLIQIVEDKLTNFKLDKKSYYVGK